MSTLGRLLPVRQVFTIVTILFFASKAEALSPKAYVGNFKDNTVSVIDTTTRALVATIPVAPGPHGMTISPDGARLYVSSDGASIVSVIDTATDRVVKTIDVGKSPHGVTLVPGMDLLLVAVNGEDKIAFVDTAKQVVIASVGVGKPHTIGVRPDGKKAYITSQVPGHFAVAVIDIEKRAVDHLIALDKTPRDLEFANDGQEVYFTEAGVNAIEVFDPKADKIVAEIPTGVSPHYVGRLRNTMYGMAIVQGPGELFLFDPKTNKPVRSIKVGAQPHWLALSGDGKTAYVTNEGADTVSIVNVETGGSETVVVGKQPRKIVVQKFAEGAKVTIVNFAFVPPVVTIAAGSDVSWSNADGGPHEVTFKNGSTGSDTLFPGKMYRKIFEQPGSYEYYCGIHNYMTGRVDVL
ncbi:MAG TPA: cupredoxin domain-containing protein [Nitrospirota bacterium]|nr:cupredoxin domain-containing protein [Nitrospirota bacterium]